MIESGRKRRSGWAEKYPPLLGIGLVLFLAIAVLPSALTLPQSNPSTTLEYAPVTDSNNAPPGGNFSSLGFGSSSGLTQPGQGGPATGGGLEGKGKSPSDKHCVGDPPRQTEDPLSPPCVAYFRGDNFGATYDGVDRDEVRIVAYVPGGAGRPTGEGWEGGPSSRCFDLGKPVTGDEDVWHRVLRSMQKYFNNRYQTYGRFVRFHLCFDGSSLPEDRRADAQEEVQEIDPFAAVNLINGGNQVAYSDEMAKVGRVVFQALPTLLDADLARYPGLQWNYIPSIERKAENFADYVCTKVVPHRVSFGGNDGDPDARLHNGKPRRLGLLRTSDTDSPNFIRLAKIVRQRVEACGGTFVAEGTYPVWGAYFVGANRVAPQNMASFKEQGVTTIIWPGGVEVDHTHAAAAIKYRPEWVFAGDEQQDGYDVGQFQEQTAWQHAWIVTNITRTVRFEDDLCWQAMREASPNAYEQDAKYSCPIGHTYEALRQLFTGIQVAGPRLAPGKIDEGFHAIPGHKSSDPRIPACFYDPGDYTCVKDATPMYWDPTGRARNGSKGCWRMVQGGKRFLTGDWPAGDVIAQKGTTSTDPCNGYSASIYGS